MNTDHWVISREENLDYQPNSELAQFWQNQVHKDYFNSTDQLPIAYAWTIPDNAHTGVVLSSGRVETYVKYQEIIFDLARNGFAVFALDHRGQGLSGRMTQDPQHGYVRDFSDYVADLWLFIEQLVKPHWTKPLSLLCHSMGGAIGAMAMLENPAAFRKAVLCSPMFGIKPALPDWLASSLIRAGLKKTQFKQKDSDYFFGQKPYTAYPFAVNALTHSKKRYSFMVSLYAEQPELRLGGVTSEWLAAALEAMQAIEDNAHNISTPTLILSSGKDRIIDNKRQAKVAAKFSNGQYQVIDGAHHELLCERDEYREPAMQTILDFLHNA